ncbi:MAG: hypothetical protein ACXVCV_24985 [Polyangia bacterium]
MKPIVTVLLLLLTLTSTVRAQPVLTLLPSPQELEQARHRQQVGRNLIIAAAALQGLAGLVVGVSFAGGYGDIGHGDKLIAVDGAATVIGFTSLVLIPIGITCWARGARRERRLTAVGIGR